MTSSSDQRLFRLEQIVDARGEDVRRLIDMVNSHARVINNLQSLSCAHEWLVALSVSSSRLAYELLQTSIANRALDNSPVNDGAIEHIERIGAALRSWIEAAEQRAKQAAVMAQAGDGCERRDDKAAGTP